MAPETLAARARQIGEDHPETAGARTTLAMVEREQLRLLGALSAFGGGYVIAGLLTRKR